MERHQDIGTLIDKLSKHVYNYIILLFSQGKESNLLLQLNARN